MKEQAHAIMNIKPLISFWALFLFTSVSYGQATKAAPPTPAYYLEKSTSNKKAGWILTGGGLGLVVAGAITATAHNSLWNPKQPQTTIGATMAVLGVASMLGGTISFVSAGHNRRKARYMTMGYEQVPLPQQGAFMTKAVPTAGIKIVF